MAPVRTIAGRAAKLERSTHGLAVDPVNDEIIVPGGADSILVFRADADIGEAPVRIIHGPRTLLSSFDDVAVDPQNDEIFVGLKRDGGVLVFSRTAQGDVPPLRILRGPKTQLRRAYRVAVDPQNDLLVVGNRDPLGLFIFNRTDEGDTAPKAIIAGPKTGLIAPLEIFGLSVYPDGKKIFMAAADKQPGSEYAPGFIGVWSYQDDGDIAPLALIKGPKSLLTRPRGVALNPRHEEIYVVNMRENALLTFVLRGVF